MTSGGFFRQESGLAVVFSLLGFFFLAVHDALARILVEAGLHPFQITGSSAWLIVAILFLPDFFRSKMLGKQRRFYFLKGEIKHHVAIAIFSIGAGWLFLLSLKHFNLMEATLIFFLAPFWMFLLSTGLLGEHARPSQWLYLVTGFIGVVIALSPIELSDLSVHHLLPIGGSVFYALRAVVVRHLRGRDSPTDIVYRSRFWVALMLTLPLFFVWQPFTAFTLSLILVCAVLLLLAHLFITKAINLGSVVIVGPLEYSALIWAALLSYLLWNEKPTLLMAFGFMLITFSGLLLADIIRLRRRVFWGNVD